MGMESFLDRWTLYDGLAATPWGAALVRLRPCGSVGQKEQREGIAIVQQICPHRWSRRPKNAASLDDAVTFGLASATEEFSCSHLLDLVDDSPQPSARIASGGRSVAVVHVVETDCSPLRLVLAIDKRFKCSWSGDLRAAKDLFGAGQHLMAFDEAGLFLEVQWEPKPDARVRYGETDAKRGARPGRTRTRPGRELSPFRVWPRRSHLSSRSLPARPAGAGWCGKGRW